MITARAIGELKEFLLEQKEVETLDAGKGECKKGNVPARLAVFTNEEGDDYAAVITIGNTNVVLEAASDDWT